MKKKILIVEDEFVAANDLQIMLQKAGYEVCGIARSVQLAEDLIEKCRPEFVLLDIYLKGKRTGIDLAKELKEQNIPFIYLSANSSEDVLSKAKQTEPQGFIVKPFREKDLLVTLEIAQYRHEHSLESRARRESFLIERLAAVMNGGHGPRERLLQAARILQQEIPFDCLFVAFRKPVTIPDAVAYLRVGFDEYQELLPEQLSRSMSITIEKLNDILKLARLDDWDKLASEIKQSFTMASILSFSSVMKDEGEMALFFLNARPDVYNSAHLSLLQRLEQLLMAEQRKNVWRFKGTVHPVPDSYTPELFNGIIGNSHLLLTVFDLVTQVAPFDTSVLILGESGTGKERIADCIHSQSPRKHKPLVKVNCAGLPPSLIESELFGHEKGAFTGAIEKRIGKFEQAQGGTIFLDEIGEMPIDLQVKLLRVLQEKEIEPIGAVSSRKIDIRFIAATNRNLEKEVAEGRFRLDLYYRLNVFPIEIPSLRERREDIPALAKHFIAIYNHKAGKAITGLSEKTEKNLLAYPWPGNIRELEHLIERSVLLARGSEITEIKLPSHAKPVPFSDGDLPLKTIHENERDYIITVLKKCRGKIWGTGGAAEILKIPPSTLKSKMIRLEIQKKDYSTS
jgi:DNA-binding NtrC family response regulator